MELFRSKNLLFLFNYHLQLEEERQKRVFFSLFCSDLTEFWSLELSEKDFTASFEADNPNLEAPPARVRRHLGESFTDGSWSCSRESGAMRLEVESTLAMLPFRFSARLRPADPKLTNRLFLRPVLGLCQLQMQSEQQLFEAFRQQSRELSKLALQFGVPDSKIKSVPFKDLSAFHRSLPESEAAGDPLDAIFDNERCQKLFSSGIRPLPKFSSPTPPPSSPEAKKSPVKPANQSVSEEERRLQLKKKLEQDAQKNKPKKKKKLL